MNAVTLDKLSTLEILIEYRSFVVMLANGILTENWKELWVARDSRKLPKLSEETEAMIPAGNLTRWPAAFSSSNAKVNETKLFSQIVVEVCFFYHSLARLQFHKIETFYQHDVSGKGEKKAECRDSQALCKFYGETCAQTLYFT